MEKVIGLDIDGVILDFERYLQAYAELYDLLVHKGKGKQREDHFVLNQYDWSLEEKKHFMHEYFPYITYKTPLMAGSIEALTILKSLGYKLCLISARGVSNPDNVAVVDEVLKAYHVPYDEAYYRIEDKVSVAKNLNISYMIEDSPEVNEAMALEGIPTFYFRNSKKDINLDLVREVSNWGEILRYIINDHQYHIDDDLVKKLLFVDPS